MESCLQASWSWQVPLWQAVSIRVLAGIIIWQKGEGSKEAEVSMDVQTGCALHVTVHSCNEF